MEIDEFEGNRLQIGEIHGKITIGRYILDQEEAGNGRKQQSAHVAVR